MHIFLLLSFLVIFLFIAFLVFIVPKIAKIQDKKYETNIRECRRELIIKNEGISVSFEKYVKIVRPGVMLQRIRDEMINGSANVKYQDIKNCEKDLDKEILKITSNDFEIILNLTKGDIEKAYDFIKKYSILDTA